MNIYSNDDDNIYKYAFKFLFSSLTQDESEGLVGSFDGTGAFAFWLIAKAEGHSRTTSDLSIVSGMILYYSIKFVYMTALYFLQTAI